MASLSNVDTTDDNDNEQVVLVSRNTDTPLGTEANPLVVSAAEAGTSAILNLIQVINGSNWMKSANYNSIVPSFVDPIMTLAYYEDTAFLGEALIDFTSVTDWEITLKRYIDDDDGSRLQDDNGNFLNLD